MDANPCPEDMAYHLTEDLPGIIVMSDPDSGWQLAQALNSQLGSTPLVNHALPKRASGIGSLVTFHEFGIAEFIVNSKPDGCFSPVCIACGGNRDSWPYEDVMFRWVLSMAENLLQNG
jgi:hypothetical protein